MTISRLLPMAILVVAIFGSVAHAQSRAGELVATCSLPFRVTSALPLPNTPMSPLIDFASIIRGENVGGVLDPNSIHVVDAGTGKPVPHALSEHFAYGDAGEVQWVVGNPACKRYEIRFRTVTRRPPLLPRGQAPLIGIGDLLRYNANAPRPFPTIGRGICRLVDLTGDGKRDFVGCGGYAYAPGWPFGGIFCFPRVGETHRFTFGDMVRVRFLKSADSTKFSNFSHGYKHADVADLNRDGLPDLVFTAMFSRKAARRWSEFKDGHKYISVYLNSGKRDGGGMPRFVLTDRLEHPKDWWGPVRAVDLDRDGAVDFVLGSMFRGEQQPADNSGYFLRNTNPEGWPIQLAKPQKLDLLKRPCFYDVDRDGKLDCVGLVLDPGLDDGHFNPNARHLCSVAWRRNLGGQVPRFSPPQPLDGVDAKYCTFTAAVNEGPQRGLLVSHDYGFYSSFFRQTDTAKQPQSLKGKRPPRFQATSLVSDSARLFGETNGCFPCDWDADGDWDILSGSCFGWVRVQLNRGTNKLPIFDPPQRVLADGKPIYFILSGTFPDLKNYGHNLGYALPVYIDWDGDGLSDLMLPNLSNRIFWYKNIGTRRQPRFGRRRQVICDGYPETSQTLLTAARTLMTVGGKSPYDPTQPFQWRARGAFGDLTGDGLPDIITSDEHKTTSLFVQYRDGTGQRRLRKVGPVKTRNGEVIKSPYPQYVLVDWDGDGLLDLIYRHNPAYISEPALARNIGTKTDPRFDTPVMLRCYGKRAEDPAGHLYYGIRDMDDDGKPDMIINMDIGTYAFYRHAVFQMKQHPTHRIGKLQRR